MPLICFGGIFAVWQVKILQIKVYDTLPDEARKIRTEVFVLEQGFKVEFDEADSRSAHLVAFDEGKPVGVCRVYYNRRRQAYTVGRIAVIKQYRGRKIGAEILKAAEDYAKQAGGESMTLHAQCRAAGFYEKQGYKKTGERDFDEYCPHIWMVKKLKV